MDSITEFLGRKNSVMSVGGTQGKKAPSVTRVLKLQSISPGSRHAMAAEDEFVLRGWLVNLSIRLSMDDRVTLEAPEG